MSKSPLVTVYITNYNYGRYLSQAIDSVLEQTFKHFELIIIDDGSTDSSREVIWGYQDHPRTRVVFQENKGLVGSINVAINAARGKYVMRLDADDYLDTNALLVMTEMMEQNPDLALVFPDYFYVDENDVIKGQERRNNCDKDVTLYDQPAHGACTLFRKKVLMEVGAYSDKRSCQDGYEVWLKIVERYPVKNINLPLFYYRRHGANLTEMEERILDARLEIKRDHVKKHVSSPLKCLAVVPVRGRVIDPECPFLEELGGYPVLEWTLKAAEQVPQIHKTIVTTPDSEIERYVQDRKTPWPVHRRSREKAIENVPLQQTLLDVLAEVEAGFVPDAIVQLTPNAPFRTARPVEEAIHTMDLFGVDVVIGVVPEEGQFYWHRGKGLEPVSNLDYGQDLRLERERLYRRAGGFQVINVNFLRNATRWDRPQIGHVVLEKHAAKEVYDLNSLIDGRNRLK